MKDKLKDKITDLAKEVAKTHFLDKAFLIERFIQEELGVRDEEYLITEQDVTDIKGYAAKEFDTHGILPLAYIEGVLAWLRSKDMLHYIVKLDGNPHE